MGNLDLRGMNLLSPRGGLGAPPAGVREAGAGRGPRSTNRGYTCSRGTTPPCSGALRAGGHSWGLE